MLFEWDEAKNVANKKKHGISFDEAAQVFCDPFRIDRVDFAHSNFFEERRQTIGLSGRVLFVVYTERKKNLRIISARKATKNEAEEYYEKNRQDDA